MTRSDRRLLLDIERLLKTGRKIFVSKPPFKNHKNLPKDAVVICDDRLSGRLKEDGYIVFDDEIWSHHERTSETTTQQIPGHIIKRLTEQWSKERRDHDRHLVAIAALVIGIIGAALTIFRDFWK